MLSNIPARSLVDYILSIAMNVLKIGFAESVHQSWPCEAERLKLEGGNTCLKTAAFG